jgi:hypothetical protein
MFTLNCEAFTKVLAKGTVFHITDDPGAKPVP